MTNPRTEAGADVAIDARGLVKRFGDHVAVDGVDLQIKRGSVYGLLGQNGAGKTTTVRMLTTLLKPDGGSAVVAGFDVVQHPNEVRRHMGLVGQSASVDELLSGRQNLWMIGRLFGLSSRDAKQRATELLGRFDLDDAADRMAKTYSGGMRRRLDLAVSLVLTPEVLFLDEPTTGLDPKSRAAVWEMIGTMTRGGTTVLLTTQYLDEADRFADRVAVIDHGKVVAEGTPAELKAKVNVASIVVAVSGRVGKGDIVDALGSAGGEVDVDEDRVSVAIDDVKGSAAIFKALAEKGVGLDDVTLRQATMDDVFLSLTRHT